MMHVILICFDRTKKERQLIVSPIMKGRIDMTKPWDPDVELSILVSETQAFTMTHILKTVKPFFDRAGVADCLLYTSPSPRDKRQSRMPSYA